MAIYIAPGVYSEEVDLSLYVPMISTSICGIVGCFRKGPMDEVTLVTSRNQFIQDFGKPLSGEDGIAAHAALYFLRFGNQLKVVRVGDSNAAKAKDDLYSADSTTLDIGDVRAISEGDWADGIQITMETDTVVTADPTVTETVYNIKVFAAGATVATDDPLEIWEDVVFDDATDSRYVEKIINGNSLYIEFVMTGEAVPDASTTWELAGGDDGTDTLDSGDITGGIDLFADATVVDVNLLSAPGFNHDETVAAYLIVTAVARADCLAILDTPDLTTAATMVNYVRGTGAYTTPLASANRAAIYGPWIQINDPYNEEDVWVPPSTRVLGVFAYSDRVAYPWYAAAGPNRGILYDTLDVRFDMTVGDIEATYGSMNNINPIRSTVDGILVDGNKDLQRKPSLLQNVNIIRMLMYAEKAIATATRYLQWEPHDEITWRQYENLVNPFLEWIANNRGITKFKVKCDSDTNTAYHINNNELVAELHMIPTTTAEKIINRYIIHAHGATLEE